MTVPSDKERIAVLETGQKHHSRLLEDTAERITSIDDKVGKILLSIEKNRGFFGGVTFAFGIVGGVVGTVVASLPDLLKRVAGG